MYLLSHHALRLEHRRLDLQGLAVSGLCNALEAVKVVGRIAGVTVTLAIETESD